MASKRIAYAGVDVSSDALHVCFEGLDGRRDMFEVANNDEGFSELLSRVTAGPRVKFVKLVLEATGPYSAGLLATAVDHAKVQAMRVDPAKAKSFNAVGARAKTDRVDARGLCSFAKSPFFKATMLPSEDALKVRKLSRHLRGMAKRRAAIKNQRHAAKVEGTWEHIEPYVTRELASLEGNMKALTKDILDLLTSSEHAEVVTHWTAIKGVSTGLVAGLLPELAALPKGLTAKQVTAIMGLDPQPRQSGQKGKRGSFPISKKGHSRARQLLWLSAVSAAHHEPAVMAYYQALLARGKLKQVACIAVMRKLLVSLWRMYQEKSAFQPSLFTSRYQPTP